MQQATLMQIKAKKALKKVRKILKETQAPIDVKVKLDKKVKAQN